MSRLSSHPDAKVLARALDDVAVPAYIVGRDRRFQWLNRAALELVGAAVGKPFARVVAPEDLNAALNAFARKLLGERTTDIPLKLVDQEGRRTSVLVSSVPLWLDNEIAGVFGLAYPTSRVGAGVAVAAARAHAHALTARQFEVLVLLSEGLGTEAIAQRLGVAEETARNHIRGLFRELGVHSRLQAVVRGYRLGLLPLGRDH